MITIMMPIGELNHVWNHNHDFQRTFHWEYRVHVINNCALQRIKGYQKS